MPWTTELPHHLGWTPLAFCQKHRLRKVVELLLHIQFQVIIAPARPIQALRQSFLFALQARKMGGFSLVFLESLVSLT